MYNNNQDLCKSGTTGRIDSSTEEHQNIPLVKLWKHPILWIILLAGLALSLTSVWPYMHEVTPRFLADDLNYHNLAITLLKTGEFQSTYRPPGYPAFVLLVYAVFGPHPFSVYVMQCFLFVFSLAIVSAIFLLITQRINIALVAAAICMCYPFFYMDMLPTLLTETFSLFLFSLFILLLLRTISFPKWWKGVVLGVLFALVCLTKAVVMPFVVVVAICLAVLPQSRRDSIQQAAIFLITTGLCLIPWTCRNWLETGAILPVSTGGGVNFWIGNYPGNYYQRLYDPERAKEWPQLPLELKTQVNGMSEVQRDNYLKHVAWGYIHDNPRRAFGLFLHKFSQLWLGSLGNDISGYEPGNKPLLAIDNFAITRTALLNVPLFVLSLIGIFLLNTRQLRLAIPVILFLAWITFAYVLTVVTGRYSLPVYPLLLGFAAIPLFQLATRFVKWATDEKFTI